MNKLAYGAFSMAAGAILMAVPALAERHSAPLPTPGLEQALKKILAEPTVKPAAQLFDPQSKPTTPVRFRTTPRKQLDGVLILGAPEAVPM